MHICSLIFGLQMIFNSPLLDTGAPPLMEPITADSNPLQIEAISIGDMDRLFQLHRVINHQLIAFTSFRVKLTREEKFVPLVGDCEIGRSSDLLLLVTSSESRIYIGALRVDKIRYRILK